MDITYDITSLGSAREIVDTYIEVEARREGAREAVRAWRRAAVKT